MSELLIKPVVHDPDILDRSIAHAREHRIVLPTFAELANPAKIPADILDKLRNIPVDQADPLNLFRIHWFNDHQGSRILPAPTWLEIPTGLSGVRARIVVAIGDTFPMIAAHKVLAAYACLVTRLVTGGIDPVNNRAIWPSTGNYCRGGIAISRILGCRGVAVLPEQMSRERFDWLQQWTLRPEQDIIRTTGSESNVKEIYDACDALSRDPSNVILNQFSEFANYLCHRNITGPSLGRLYEQLARKGDRLYGLVAGTGSAGTIAAGDYLKDRFGSNIIATEPLECPTMLNNGYGEHRIQGIGDKHIPLIHNVLNMDYVVGISDSGPDLMNVLFNTREGLRFAAARSGVSEPLLMQFRHIGLSGLANIQTAIKMARRQDLGSNDLIICIATDGARLYASEIEHARQKYFNGQFGETQAAEVFGRTLSGCEPAHVLELSSGDKQRIFNLGYYTWVEQRGIPIQDFNSRKNQSFWDDISGQADEWDRLISLFNQRVALK